MVHPLDQPIRPTRRRRRSSDAPTPEATPVPGRAAAAGTEGPTSSDGGRRTRETFAAHLFRRATMEATTMEGAGDSLYLYARDSLHLYPAGAASTMLPPRAAKSTAPPSTTVPGGSFEEQLEKLKHRTSSSKARHESGRSRTSTGSSSTQLSSSSGSASSVQSGGAEREGVRRRQNGPNPFAFF